MRDPAQWRLRAFRQVLGTHGGRGERGRAGGRSGEWGAARGGSGGCEGGLGRAGASVMGMEGEDWGLRGVMEEAMSRPGLRARDRDWGQDNQEDRGQM